MRCYGQRMGWGYMPRHVVADDLASGLLVQIQTAGHPLQGAALPMQCVYRADRHVGPALSWWLDALTRLTNFDTA